MKNIACLQHIALKGFYLEKPASCWNPANPVFFIPSYLLEYMRLRKNISISFSQSLTAIINIISSEGCRIPVYIIHYSSLLKLSNLYKPGNASLRTPSLHHHLYHTKTTTNLKPYEPGKYLPHPLLTSSKDILCKDHFPTSSIIHPIH